MPFNAAAYNWAPCVPELLVEDFQTSLRFYRLLGFVDQYQRTNFAYLDYHGAQLMIAQRDNYWETGAMERPFGRGINLQFATHELDALLARSIRPGLRCISRAMRSGAIWAAHRADRPSFWCKTPMVICCAFCRR